MTGINTSNDKRTDTLTGLADPVSSGSDLRQFAQSVLSEVDTGIVIPRTISGAIFDFDGTVAQTKHAHNEPLQNTFQQIMGFEIPAAEWHILMRSVLDSNHGDETDVIAQLKERLVLQFPAVQASLMDIDKQEILARSKKYFAENILSIDIPAIAGTLELLSKFQSHNIPIGLCTNSWEDFVLPILDRLNLREAFNRIVSYDGSEKRKPAPDSYLRMCSDLGVQPGSVVAFEDSVAGVIAAYRAGISRTIWCPSFVPSYDLKSSFTEMVSRFPEAYNNGAQVILIKDWSQVEIED